MSNTDQFAHALLKNDSKISARQNKESYFYLPCKNETVVIPHCHRETPALYSIYQSVQLTA